VFFVFRLTISRRTFYAQFESWGFYTASVDSKRKAETRSAFRQIFGWRITPTQPPWSGRRDVEACAIGKGIVEWLI
jgi:hypothetical protein